VLGKSAFALLCASALAATLIGLAEETGASAGRLQAPCTQSDVFVFAHEDDPLLFMMPALANDVAAGDCVRLVELTAGDSGLGTTYWQSRELGLRAALAYVAHQPSSWAEHDAGIPGHPAAAWRLSGDPKLSVVFLNLPDGRSDGTGFAADGDQSLYKLWYSDIPTMTSVDGLATYSRADLINALGLLINRAKATFVGAQDYDAPFTIVPNHDHYDHIAGALFTDQAVELYARAVNLVRFQDYSIVNLPPNLSSSQAAEKAGAFQAYLPYDPMVQPACTTTTDCARSIYGLEALREYSAPEPKPYPSG
jgi:LmbE family N-acetylglucosaminyl deacetylase